MSIKTTIKSLDFFSSLDEKELELLSSFATLTFYSKDYIVHYEKKECTKLLFLLDGLAKAFKIDKYENEIFLYYVYRNSLLSEISNIKSDSIYSFSNIEIIEDATILSIDFKRFKEEFLNKNLLCLEFTNEVIKRSQQLQTLVNREFIFDSVAKVAMMLNSDIGMFNKLKRQEISLMLHIQPATLSRVLTRLKRNNIIDIIQGKISVLDETALKAIFEE